MLKDFTTVELDKLGELVGEKLSYLYSCYDQNPDEETTKEIEALEELNNIIFSGEDVFCLQGFDKDTLISFCDISEGEFDSLSWADLFSIRDKVRYSCKSESATMMGVLSMVVRDKLEEKEDEY